VDALKRAFLFSLLAMVLALLLPLWRAEEAEETAPPAEMAESLGEWSAEAGPRQLGDADFELRVLHGGKVMEMDMEEYLPMALAGEMPASFEAEALKAQAVALRSYALHYRDNPKAVHPEADICTDSGCCCAALDKAQREEKWGADAAVYWEKLCAAAAATDGQYLCYEQEAILAMFHSSSLGATEAGTELKTPLPYLRSVESPETEMDVGSILSQVEVSRDDFRATVLRSFPTARLEGEPESWLGEVRPSAGGRVGSMVLGGQEISGLALRQLFALRSTDFELEWTGECFLFTVRGYGHGLGMSQYGANTMARSGADYAEILGHYYPGAELVVAMAG